MPQGLVVDRVAEHATGAEATSAEHLQSLHGIDLRGCASTPVTYGVVYVSGC